MPPTDAPSARTYPRLPRPQTPLFYLSSPVPDLASSLHDPSNSGPILTTSEAMDDANDANATFLREALRTLDSPAPSSAARRTHIDALRDPRLHVNEGRTSPPAQSSHNHVAETVTRTTTRSRPAVGETSEDFSRRERLERVLARLNRMHTPPTPSSAAQPSPSNFNWGPHIDRADSPVPDRNPYAWDASAPLGFQPDDRAREERELDAILSELRSGHLPGTHSDHDNHGNTAQNTDGISGDLRAALEENQSLSALERRSRERLERARENEWLSLRNRAMMQRARQEFDGANSATNVGSAARASTGASPSATERMLRYVMERERSGMSEEEDRARGAGWFRPTPNRARGAAENEQEARDPANAQATSVWGERQDRIDAFRWHYLPRAEVPRIPRNPTPAPSVPPQRASPTAVLENALRYLAELRSCTRREDALTAAIKNGLTTSEGSTPLSKDLIMDLEDVQPLPYSTWLQPGTVFEGFQFAGAAGTPLTLGGSVRSRSNTQRRQRSHQAVEVEQINPHYRSTALSPSSLPIPSSLAFGPTAPTPPPHFVTTATSTASEPQATDQWPVRLCVHSFSPETMTLEATMEAYDVPFHHALPASAPGARGANARRRRAGRKERPVRTFVLGEVVDLKAHVFLTPRSGNGKADMLDGSAESLGFPDVDLAMDARNWLLLPPFSEMGLAKYDADYDRACPGAPPTQWDLATRAAAAAETLLSPEKWRALSEEFIFMRWKEKCFIPCPSPSMPQTNISMATGVTDSNKRDSPATTASFMSGDGETEGHGLTISGFYYVSLRRSDGRIEGLYFDPGCAPLQNQVLRLQGRGTGWGEWGFR